MAYEVDGHPQRVLLTVRPLHSGEAVTPYLLISFEESASLPSDESAGLTPNADSATERRLGTLTRELAYTRENLQTTIEKQQVFNEELQSTNEELQSTNEELQSANEELETSKEELQSVNEELVSVNAELQAKIEQLAAIQSDMKNLLDNISVGAVFLDLQLAIRRFTREAGQIYRLVATDVGRPLSDIKSEVVGDLLVDLPKLVLETREAVERHVRTGSGALYQVRVQPYRTLDNIVDGVVLTFVNISERIAGQSAEGPGPVPAR